MADEADGVVNVVQGWLGEQVTGGRIIDLRYGLLENGVLTSMQTVELVLFLEERFGISVSEEEFVEENFASIARIAHFVEEKSP